MMKPPTLKIGDIEVNPPIIQGGMGVRVSGSRLAAAVANEGCVGVIASVGLGKYEDSPGVQQVAINNQALRDEIRKAKSMSKGIIGVNIMVALDNYENLVRISVEEGADIIISGAGLPLILPKLTKGSPVKLIPIVSSARALKIIHDKWLRSFNRVPDAVIVEGFKGGGHLGFSYKEIAENTYKSLEEIIVEVVQMVKSFPTPFPVIAGGGIFDGKDINNILALGASGVQMATRFVCTTECDVHENFKAAYINCQQKDIAIINSPLGMPGRVIKNKFVDRIANGETIPYKCLYLCLRSCDPKVAPYCIAKVLANAAEGNLDEAIIFAGANAYKCTEILPVKELIKKIIEEMSE